MRTVLTLIASALLLSAQAPPVSIAPPPGTDGLNDVRWLQIQGPGQHKLIAALARPDGPGPFPTVLLLHGTHGFAREYVQLARDFARNGLLAIAACWFAGGRGAGLKFVTPIACADAPPIPIADSTEARTTVDTIVSAIKTLPDVDAKRIALFGHSRGGGASLHYILESNNIRAVAVNSAGYPLELAQRASQQQVPILMLHGTADSEADGGSAMTSWEMARNFEKALRTAGKPVEVKYYQDGRHNDLFQDPERRTDTVQTIVRFLRTHLYHR